MSRNLISQDPFTRGSCKTCSLQLRCLWAGAPTSFNSHPMIIRCRCGNEILMFPNSNDCQLACNWFRCFRCNWDIPLYGRYSIYRRREFYADER